MNALFAGLLLIWLCRCFYLFIFGNSLCLFFFLLFVFFLYCFPELLWSLQMTNSCRCRYCSNRSLTDYIMEWLNYIKAWESVGNCTYETIFIAISVLGVILKTYKTNIRTTVRHIRSGIINTSLCFYNILLRLKNKNHTSILLNLIVALG